MHIVIVSNSQQRGRERAREGKLLILSFQSVYAMQAAGALAVAASSVSSPMTSAIVTRCVHE